ncbi:uncharacterized protein [Watersipora subatra]|uniref:uncharacterized protein n=1 Tax=Watersipora subatra TaxID=2589382 RepID=UPI00355B7EA8
MLVMKRSWIRCILWLLAHCTLESYQASVSESCPASETKAQCYTVSFKRSVQEGHDSSIILDPSKESFLLTIYSNTISTDLLQGYKVTVTSGCDAETVSVTQMASQMIDKCGAELQVCSATQLELELNTDKNAIKNDIFYSEVRLPQPSSNFQLTIIPQFEDDTQNPESPDGFTPTDISSFQSKGKSTECSVSIAKGSSQKVRSGTIAAAALFAVLLALAAVVARVHVLCVDKFIPRKHSLEESTELTGQKYERMEAGSATNEKSPMS